MKAIFISDKPNKVREVYGETALADLSKLMELETAIYSREAILADPAVGRGATLAFSTWGMPAFTEEEIETRLPDLKALFYAAGTVQTFARPFLNCGVKVFSAWAANAVPVAEFTAAQIILAGKGYYRAAASMSRGEVEDARKIADLYNGNYEETVGILGAGMVGRAVIRLLKSYELSVFVFDPFLSEETARDLGVEKCSLAGLFAACRVVSNHLANNEKTRGMLDGALFDRMLPNATFINTGRGAQVVEEDLAAFLARRPDVTALLDVTDPEPPLSGHPFYDLPNCILTPHIAGSKGREVHRMAATMAEECRRYLAGEPTRYEVTLPMLETMA